MRIDLVLDMAGSPSDRAIVDDDFYRDLAYRLVDLVYSGEPPLREHPLAAPVRLPCNPLPDPDLAPAEHHAVAFTGGMMGMMPGGVLGGYGRGSGWGKRGAV